MENDEEAIRLEVKTDPEAVRKQAAWCGIKPGMRVLDVGCGSGKTTSVLHEMIQPGGSIVGVDYSEERVSYARDHYGQKKGIGFSVHDLMEPMNGLGQFDIIWVRFILEYFRVESSDIVKNLKDCLKPGGYLCLIDLDYNCLSHYDLPSRINDFLHKLMIRLDQEYNFDTYAGRKLYAYLYDLEFENIQMHLMAHHLIYGKNIREGDIFNWIKKVEIAAKRLSNMFESYPGGYETFFLDFKNFFLDPRRFTYTPLILCKGRKPTAN
jgi:ubiquinone/menaquinone biosynthesis C-methylase UbiE